MAVEGIGSLAQDLADQLRGQTLNPQAGANTPDSGKCRQRSRNRRHFYAVDAKQFRAGDRAGRRNFPGRPGSIDAIHCEYPVCACDFQRTHRMDLPRRRVRTTTNAGNRNRPRRSNSNATAHPDNSSRPSLRGKHRPPRPTHARMCRNKFRPLTQRSRRSD